MLSMSDLILDLLNRLTPSFESKDSSFLESGVIIAAKDSHHGGEGLDEQKHREGEGLDEQNSHISHDTDVVVNSVDVKYVHNRSTHLRLINANA